MADLPTLPPSQQQVLKTVLRLAQTCEYEVKHTTHVTFLAIRFFESLSGLHGLDEPQRTWLVYAGLLHDIGWIEGWKNHHKTTLRIILNTPMLPFENKERLIIGSVARYHRKSLPNLRHDHYAALTPDERRTVDILASFLRLADGLDRSHQQRVNDVTCRVTSRRIIVTCDANGNASEELQAAQTKKDLLEQSFDRKVLLKGLG